MGINDIGKFVFIDNFSSVITLLVGLSAYKIYALQKRDSKLNAARIILSEIRGAELRTDKVIEILHGGGQDFPSVLPVNSWKIHSYLFASDFDQDELSELNHFYSTCDAIDQYVRRDNEYFWITTQIRTEIAQQMLSKFVEEAYDKKLTEVDDLKVQGLIEKVLMKYVNHGYSYAPQKTRNELQKLVSQFRRISTTSVGSKLKHISGI